MSHISKRTDVLTPAQKRVLLSQLLQKQASSAKSVLPLSSAQQSLRNSSLSPIPPLMWQYKDFVRWQTEMLASEEGERLWTYWQKQLAGELPVLNLPTDRPRPPVQTYR
ncbi:MAG: hypothetical protein JOZ78_22490, partial [Chroococcidiopsidaceae cyanobacterium CP_BM_ER_R8_30]|nr:hypothetical protein [Chroococcidiopsidaceae cyanobacterium CP_BM_ER_R8_30]